MKKILAILAFVILISMMAGEQALNVSEAANDNDVAGLKATQEGIIQAQMSL